MKVHRHIMLHPTLSQVADQYEELHGASFTKIVTAALLQYLVADSAAERSHHMRLAIRLERGALTLAQIRDMVPAT